MEEEIWRDIPGYEGLYQASNLGRVRSLDRTEEFLNNNGKISTRHRKGIILKPVVAKNGYCVVSLCGKTYKVHRIIASIFVDNSDNLPQVNHKDENKLNNRANNLEWCTGEYNYNYGTRYSRCVLSNINNKKKSKPVLQYTLDGEFVRRYPSANEVRRVLKKSISYICECCKGKAYTAYGFIWKYERETV